MDTIFIPSSFPIFISLLAIFTFAVSKLRNKSKPKLPPGPWKLPIIGNAHQMIGGLPHHTLRSLSNKHGPLMHLQLGELSTVVISSPEMAMEVMKKHDVIFASRPNLFAAQVITYNYKDIAFAPYGPYWRQVRRICTSELLSAGRVQSFRYLRQEEASAFTKSIAASAGKPVNLTEKIFSLSSSITSRATFGTKIEEQQVFISTMDQVVKLGGGFSVADLFPSIELLRVVTGMKRKLEDLFTKVDRILETIIKEHKLPVKPIGRHGDQTAVEDLVDVLLKYMDGENPLTMSNIKSIIIDMFTGGTDTSSSTVEWAMAEMIKNPGVMEKAQVEVRRVFDKKGEVDETDFQELHYLKFVIKETLRLHPVVPLLLPRECGKKCEIDGYEIPLKAKVIINAWAIGRDPKYWNDPDSFSPERFEDSSIDFKGGSFEFIPFGAGRRICPGILFGMANTELNLALLLYHFDWKLPDGMKRDKFDMTEQFGSTVKRKEELVLIPIVYPQPII